MRIVGAEVIPYWLPFRDQYVTARGRLDRREMVLLRLVDEEGREGWGEAVPLSLRGGADLTQVIGDLEAWATEAQARSGATENSASALLEALAAPARCAVLTALADLEARQRHIPVWQLLGARERTAVPCNATLVSGPPAAVAADAERWAADGFTTFKLKVGLLADGPVAGHGASGRRQRGTTSDVDLSQIEAVRDAIGADARIRLDANGAWSVDRAEAVLHAATSLDIELVEQPVASLHEMAELRRRLHHARRDPTGGGRRSTAVPIAADESVNSSFDAVTARDAAACDLTTIKLSKVGALRPDLAGALPFYLSSALDGPIGIAAAAHAFQALSDTERAALPPYAGTSESGIEDAIGQPTPLAQGLATQRLFAETIASRECNLEGPLLQLPPGPGLGVEIDPVALAAHRL